jgi:hypothetical protein
VKYLFIGGPADGQWLEVKHPPPSHWQIAVPSLPDFKHHFSMASTHVYRLERMETSCETAQAQVHSLYLSDRMTVAQMVDALIQGYVGHRI